ncbi:MAG: hypothetical protein AB7R55_10675 [Gemmatimonadales bacterium]
MPVTAKLSQLFYDRLGEQVANELVDWFNAVDATYRADLRELNELNFGRFDAKLEQRLAELRAELRTELRTELARIEVKIGQLEARIDERAASITASVEQRLAVQGRWLIAGWVSILAAVIGLWAKG